MKLTLGWLYDDLMNTYGDRGNALILKDRAEKRGIHLEIVSLSVSAHYRELRQADVFLMGGAEDRQQKIVSADLVGDKKKVLADKIHEGTPGLYICGAYQFLGQYYEAADTTKVRCLNILPFHTKHPGTAHPRLIGDIVVKITNPTLVSFLSRHNPQPTTHNLLIGFENHGGRTHIDSVNNAIGKTLKGYGNNGHDHYEGYVHNNTIGTYCHGPILPRNPLIADFLLHQALQKKYPDFTELSPLADDITEKNRAYLLGKLGVI